MFRADITYHRDDFNLAVSLQLNKGRITALLGESGSGKSTLFRLLSGLDKPHSGRIYSDKNCWFESKENINLAIQKRNVGLVFQDYALFEHLSVEENIAYGIKQGKNPLAVKEWLNKTNLLEKATAYPNSLSGGEKQRVALARVLAASPDVLFLDEPFSALDEHLRHGLRRELQDIISHTQIPVVIATHDLKEARFLAEYVYVMSKGNIIQSGAINDVFNNPASVQAAKVLGWQNLLSVDSANLSRVSGQWGEISLLKDCSDIICVGIPMNALSLCAYDDSELMFTATLTHIINMQFSLFLEVKLPSKENLVLQVDASNSLEIGQKLNIYIDTSLIKTFNQ